MTTFSRLDHEGCIGFQSVIDFLNKNATSAIPANGPRNACRDPEDLEILGIADSADARFIITGGKDLLEVDKYKNIQIVTPRQFWGIIQQQGPGK